MNSKEMIQQNNGLRKQLNDDNKRYYEELLTYVRLTLNIDEQKTEEVMLEILQDLLEAQKNGRTAEEFFGKGPQEIGDALIAELPKESLKGNLTLFFMIFFILVQIKLIDTLMEPVVTIGLFKTGLPILLLIVAMYFLLHSLKYRSFKRKQYLFSFLSLLCWIGAVIVPIINDKMNGIGPVTIISHQLFALILLIFSSFILVHYYRSGSYFSEIFPTIIFILLELSVLLKIINPLTLSDFSKLLFSIILLVVVFTMPLLSLSTNQKNHSQN